MIAWPAKDPADIADYTWTPDLDAGDTIATFSATVTTGTVTQPESATFTDTQGTVWIAGGADTELAILSLVITTNGGRTFKEAATIPVFNRSSETLAVFRVRYPQFATTSDGQVSYWLYDSLPMVSGWADQATASALYAAHRLTLASQPQGVTSFKSGTFSATVSDAQASRTSWNATPYGIEFLAMVKRLRGTVQLVNGTTDVV